MRYALNVAPINGWETHLGSGQAPLVLAADGVAYARNFGTGTVSMTLAAGGAAYARKYGVGSAPQVLSATGDGSVLPFAGGRAHLLLDMSGIGRVAWRGTSAALISLQAVGHGVNATRGLGAAGMVLSGRYGIPQPIVTPTVFNASIKARTLLQAGDNRAFTVPQQYELAQPGERRRVPVVATNRSL